MSDDIQTQIQQIEQENAQHREHIAMADVAKRLKDNKDFKVLISDYFCTKECARYAKVSSDFNLSEESRQDALANAQAAGHLERFINNVIQMGDMGAKAIRDNEREIDQIRTDSTKGDSAE